MDDNILRQFFSRSFEKAFNEKMLYRNYVFDSISAAQYLTDLLSAPYSNFISYMIDNYNVSYLSPEDVLQYSSFDDATTNICAAIKKHNDEGFKALEIGKFLEDDGKERKDTAYIKYGENHAKTAESLGLVFNLSNVYFLSCIGYSLDTLSDKERRELLARLIIRNRLVQRLIYRSLSEKQSSFMKETDFLTESTANRRKSNNRYLFQFISSIYPDCTAMFSSIIF